MTKSTAKKSPLTFFLLVYGLSVPFWLIETLIDVKGLPLNIPITDLYAAFTPLAAAGILVRKEEGRVGVKKLFRRIVDCARINPKTGYLPVLFLPGLLYCVIYLAIHFAGLPLPDGWISPFGAIPLFLAVFFLGAVVEETGYMGYAIDPMRQRFGALRAGILMGIPWVVWHYPSIIQQGHNWTWIAWATLGTIGVRVLIVWIYMNTHHSVFACILFHTSLNMGRALFPADSTHNPLVDYPAIHYSVLAIAAGIVVFGWGSETLARYRYA